MKTTGIRLLGLVLLSSLAVFAEDFTWGNTYAQSWSGFGTSPYVALGNGANPNITIFCLDFNDEIGPPYNWTANVWDLNSANVQNNAQYGGNYNNLLNTAYGAAHSGQSAPNQISGTPFAFVTDSAGGGYSADLSASPDAYSRYLEAAWLFAELQAAGAQSELALVAQVAAWDLFVNSNNLGTLRNDIAATNGNGNIYGFADYVDPSATATASISGVSFQQAVDYALNAAQAAVVTNKTFNGAGWTLVTGDPTWVESADGKTIPAQEFLSPNGIDPSPVPEPTAVILLATVAGMVGFGKRKGLI